MKRNWIFDLWAAALTDESPIEIRGQITTVKDAAAIVRADTRECYADSFAEVVLKSPRMDAQAANFARLLATQTLSGIEKHEYPEMKWVNGGLIAITSEVDEGADHYMWLEQSVVDEGDKLLSNDADDFPLVDVEGAENFGRVHSFGRAFQYTAQDVRKSRFHGVTDIVRDKAVATREAIDRNFENLITDGEPSAKLAGIFTAAIPNARAAIGGWEDITPSGDDPFAQIHEEFRFAHNRIHVNSNGIEEPDTALFSQALLTFLQSTRNSSASDRMILEQLKVAWPNIKRWDWTRQNATGGRDVNNDAAPCLLLYKNDASRIRVELPMPPTPSEVEKRGRRFLTEMEARYGSLIIKRPQSLLRVDGV